MGKPKQASGKERPKKGKTMLDFMKTKRHLEAKGQRQQKASKLANEPGTSSNATSSGPRKNAQISCSKKSEMTSNSKNRTRKTVLAATSGILMGRRRKPRKQNWDHRAYGVFKDAVKDYITKQLENAKDCAKHSAHRRQ